MFAITHSSKWYLCCVRARAVQELIGHCSALYTANRDATLALEEHLEQYGYVTQNNDTREPEDPCAAIEPPHRVHDVAAPASPRSADLDPHSSSMALQVRAHVCPAVMFCAVLPACQPACAPCGGCRAMHPAIPRRL